MSGGDSRTSRGTQGVPPLGWETHRGFWDVGEVEGEEGGRDPTRTLGLRECGVKTRNRYEQGRVRHCTDWERVSSGRGDGEEILVGEYQDVLLWKGFPLLQSESMTQVFQPRVIDPGFFLNVRPSSGKGHVGSIRESGGPSYTGTGPLSLLPVEDHLREGFQLFVGHVRNWYSYGTSSSFVSLYTRPSST